MCLNICALVHFFPRRSVLVVGHFVYVVFCRFSLRSFFPRSASWYAPNLTCRQENDWIRLYEMSCEKAGNYSSFGSFVRLRRSVVFVQSNLDVPVFFVFLRPFQIAIFIINRKVFVGEVDPCGICYKVARLVLVGEGSPSLFVVSGCLACPHDSIERRSGRSPRSGPQ